MELITREQYDSYSEQDKQTVVKDLHREMFCLKENQKLIADAARSWLDKGNDPRDLTVVIAGRYDPFLPQVYRDRYPPVDKAVIEVGLRNSVAETARQCRWDPESEVGKYWTEKNKQHGFVLPKKDTPLYTESAHILENLELAPNEFSVVIATHCNASVFSVAVPAVGLAAQVTELDGQSLAKMAPANDTDVNTAELLPTVEPANDTAAPHETVS